MAEDRLIAVTGATGFVGRAVCRALREAHCPVVPIVRGQGALHDLVDPVAVGQIDATTSWVAALKNVTSVIHCAARVHVMHDTSSDPLAEFRAVNTAGTRALAEQAAACGVRRLVFVSSIKVMGKKTALGRPFLADDEPAPQDPYGRSKWEAEQALQEVAKQTGIEIVVVRPPLVYGPGMGGNFEQLVRLIKRGVPLPFATIHNRRSLIALDNLVQLLAICATHPLAAGETFLASDGTAPSTPELIRAIAAAHHSKTWLWPFPTGGLRLAGLLTGRLAQIERLTESLEVDDRKTREVLDWQPLVTFEEGIRRAVLSASP